MFAARARNQELLKAYGEESLAIARETGDRRGEIWPLIFLGIWAGGERDYARSTARYEEAIAIAHETGSRELVAIALNNLGVNAADWGDHARAAALFEDARVISRELDAHEDVALETLNLASALCMVGRIDDAADEAFDGLSLALELESDRAVLLGLLVVLEIQSARGDRDGSARLVGSIETLRDRLGEAAESSGALEETIEQLVATLGREQYEIALGQGRAMSLETVVDTALASLDAR